MDGIGDATLGQLAPYVTDVAGELRREVPDLRMPLLGAAAWLGGLAVQVLPGTGRVAAVGIVAGAVIAGCVAWTRGAVTRRTALTAAGVLLVGGAAACVGLVRQAQGARPYGRAGQGRRHRRGAGHGDLGPA